MSEAIAALIKDLSRCSDYELIVRPHHVTLAKQSFDEISSLRARLEKAEAERDAAFNDGLEAAAKMMDCTCEGRSVVLSPDVRSNSKERWDACGDPNCCALAALDIRLLKSKS